MDRRENALLGVSSAAVDALALRDALSRDDDPRSHALNRTRNRTSRITLAPDACLHERSWLVDCRTVRLPFRA
jgi:hypothetical protein